MLRIIIYSVISIVIQCDVIPRSSDCDIKYVFNGKRGLTIADCKNRGLQFIPQDLPPDINVLDISSNHLRSIENSSLINYTHLQELNVRKNQLKHLSQESFQGLHHLVVLDMSHNLLDLSYVYSEELFLPIQHLSKLDIRSNMPQPENYNKQFDYPDHAFGVLRELTFLGIDMMPVPIFGGGFSQMKKLRKLYFQSCYLVRLSNETFQKFSSSVEELYLRNCRLNFVKTEYDALNPFPNLRVLDLFGTFMHLTRALLLLHPYRYRNMTKINLGHVSDLIIDSDDLPYALTITSDIVKNLKSICIEHLDLSQNGIVDYTNGSLFSFDYPECLKHLSLKGNRLLLAHINNHEEIDSFFSKALRLQSLDYSYNVVNFFIEHSMTSRSASNFKSSGGSHVILPASLEKLDISFTIVNTLRFLFIVPTNNNLTYLDISYTNTTVTMLFVELRLETFISAGTRYSFGWREIDRFQETNLKRLVLKDATLTHGIETYGNRFFEKCQSVESLDISKNSIWHFSDDIFKPMPNLSNLYLTDNFLQSIPEQLNTHTNIKVLDVRNNLLTTINSLIRNWADQMQANHGMTLSLDGNAFICNCDNLDFIRWIHTTKVDLDSRSYKCQLPNGSVTDTLTAYNSFSELFADCKSTMWLTFASTLLSSFITISLLLLLYNRRWKIALSFYGVIRRTIEQKVRKAYQYDVYMSYEGKIVIWIKNVLAPKLEDEWGLTMCIKDRDFLIGESLLDTEAKCIKNSRYIIFLITSEFKSSRDCLFELDRAKYEKVTKNLDRIIVITKDIIITDIPYEFSYIWNYAYVVQWPKEEEDLNDTWRRLKMLLTDCQVQNKQAAH
ncbi:toll-like receptor 6 [Mytilus trossulus]|uniref:toll-like receptor 6 n=1 Tax=Mytilus trossulus TaxID=6551 RepID=UPI003003BC04